MTAVQPETAWVGALPVATPALYDVRIAHTRSTPLENSFEYRGYLWLVDLDDVADVRPAQGRPLPRWLRAQGAGYYTIGSSGHEGNAAVAAGATASVSLALTLLPPPPRTGHDHMQY